MFRPSVSGMMRPVCGSNPPAVNILKLPICLSGLLVTGTLLLVKTVLSAAEPASEVEASISEEDRQHWSYRPVKRPPIPDVKSKDWVRTPIDGFVLHRLEKQGWRPAPAAKPRALMRRMYLGLVGLPPTLEEQQAGLAESTPAGFDGLMDRLLARKGYGERWARHWLDLVRFAETNGYERDAIKPHGWRYRDYIIRSFNEDKPYNQFVLEQLAGD